MALSQLARRETRLISHYLRRNAGRGAGRVFRPCTILPASLARVRLLPARTPQRVRFCPWSLRPCTIIPHRKPHRVQKRAIIVHGGHLGRQKSYTAHLATPEIVHSEERTGKIAHGTPAPAEKCAALIILHSSRHGYLARVTQTSNVIASRTWVKRRGSSNETRLTSRRTAAT